MKRLLLQVIPMSCRRTERALPAKAFEPLPSCLLDQWPEDDEPDDAPELCEHCEFHPAMYQTSEGWLCGSCDRRLNPRGADDG